MKYGLVRVLMALAIVYDGGRGVALLGFTAWTFEQVQTPPPGEWMFLHLVAALLIVFAWMYVCVIVDPVRYAPFIAAGMGLKAASVGVTIYYWQTTGVGRVWLWQAGIDVGWLMLFIVLRSALPRWWNRPDYAIGVRPPRPRP